MRIAIRSGDPIFVSAAAGLAGALGHPAATETDESPADVVVCDVGAIDFAGAAATLDPLRTVLFLPANPSLLPPPAALSAFLHVFPRTALAVELPRLLALLAEQPLSAEHRCR